MTKFYFLLYSLKLSFATKFVFKHRIPKPVSKVIFKDFIVLSDLFVHFIYKRSVCVTLPACPITTSFPHGSVTSATDGLALSFTCDAGYVLVGESTLTCNTETNTWSNTNPTCGK